jgi:hypothetical protein
MSHTSTRPSWGGVQPEALLPAEIAIPRASATEFEVWLFVPNFAP